jgi:PAS domain S-box-containing protein
MLTTYWNEPHEFSAGELRALDPLARLAADLIERARAEESARESEERLRFAQESANIGTFDSNLETGAATWTPKLEQIHGLAPGAFGGTRADWLALIHPEDRDRVERRVLEARATGAPAEEEWRVIWPDRSVHWISGRWKVLKDAAGKPVRVMGAHIDVTDRKRMEQALRESEERFRDIADTAPVMIWISGPDKLCTFFNQPWLQFRGRTMEDEIGNGWLSGVHSEDQERCNSIYCSAFDARRSFQMEYRIQGADGEYRWFLDNGTPRYREGDFVGYIGSCVDITWQKGVEEQLRSNQVQLIDSQRLAKVGSWDLDVATRKTRWSDEWYRIFGLPRDVRADHQTFLDCVHPKDREAVLEAEMRSRTAVSPFSLEFRIVRPDGEMRYIRSMVEAVRNDHGTLVRLAGAAQDITEQVKATELLRESEGRLKYAERMTHVGHWTWDLATNRVSWSEEMFRIMGQPGNYALGYTTYLEMVPPGDRERLAEWVSNRLAEKRGGVIEHRVVRPDGDVRTVICTCEVVLHEDGSPQLLVGACQDVTEARRAQAESFARQKLESLGTLASGIAHDFNNLLGAVLAQTELAIAVLASGSNPEDELNAVRDLSIRGSEIVRQLMIYAGNESDVAEVVDVSKVVEGMSGLLKLAVSRHATLVINLGDNLPTVRARPAQLSQILMNLVVNASDAIGDRDGVIRVTTEHAADFVRLEVSDTGCGMTPETQAKVFDPFFTTKFSGRGIGLAVVHGIVRSLRGSIHIASEPGKGSTFQILLPYAESARTAGTAGASAAEASAPPALRASVLIVEDEEQLRLAVARMLRKAGLEVFEAATGTEAIGLLRARGGGLDLILLDLTIPGSSSQEVIVEAEFARPDMKAILTSAYAEEAARAMISSPLVCGFIRKPFSVGDLLQTLRRVLHAGGRTLTA